MKNEVIISGKVMEAHMQFKKDGINYGTISIKTKSKYEMNDQLITCTFGGKIFNEEWNNIKANANIECIGHIIEDDGKIQILVDEINYL